MVKNGILLYIIFLWEKIIMNKIVKKLSTVVAALALLITSGIVNTGCLFLMYQPELPEGAEKLYK